MPTIELPKEIVVMLAAMLPITELRGAIPLGITVFGLNPWQTACWAVVGNFAPVYPILMLLRPFSEWSAKRLPFLNRVFEKISSRANSNHGERMERYGAVALVFFVAIPSPGTGAWTGALLAFLFGMPWRYAVPAIATGLITAAVLVTTLTTSAVGIARLISNPIVSLLLLSGAALFVYAITRRSGSEPHDPPGPTPPTC